jgi:hypothetical protein
MCEEISMSGLIIAAFKAHSFTHEMTWKWNCAPTVITHFLLDIEAFLQNERNICKQLDLGSVLA